MLGLGKATMKVIVRYLGMSRDIEIPMGRLAREMQRQGTPGRAGYYQPDPAGNGEFFPDQNKGGHLWEIWGPELTLVIEDPLSNWVHVPDYTPRGVIALHGQPERRAWLEIWHEGEPLATLPVVEAWNEAGQRVFPIEESADPGCH